MLVRSATKLTKQPTRLPSRSGRPLPELGVPTIRSSLPLNLLSSTLNAAKTVANRLLPLCCATSFSCSTMPICNATCKDKGLQLRQCCTQEEESCTAFCVGAHQQHLQVMPRQSQRGCCSCAVQPLSVAPPWLLAEHSAKPGHCTSAGRRTHKGVLYQVIPAAEPPQHPLKRCQGSGIEVCCCSAVQLEEQAAA